MRTDLTLYLFVLLFINGCASMGYPKKAPTCADIGLNPLPDSMERIKFEAFTVLPPQGENWCIANLTRKRGNSENEVGVFLKNQFGGQILQSRPPLNLVNQSLIANVLVQEKQQAFKEMERVLGFEIKDISTSAEFAEYTGQLIDKQKQMAGYKVNFKELQIRPFNHETAICIQVEHEKEGYLSNTHPNELYVEHLRTINCIHPTRSLLFSIGYSERFSAKDPPAVRLIDKSEKELYPFITGFEFNQ
jgi:hypothetical protein